MLYNRYNLTRTGKTAMTTNELKKLIESGDIETITFFAGFKAIDDETPIWEVFSYGSKAASAFGDCLKNSSREGGNKTYTSLDRAYSAMKKLGYNGRFEIDG
jgi:hypothetical protein